MTKKLWDCSIFIEENEIPNGGDNPPRKAAIEAVESMGLTVSSCSSGWGGEDNFPKIAKLKARIAELESRLSTQSINDIKADAVKKFGAWFVSSRHMRSTTTDVDEVASLYARLLSKGE